MVSKILAAVALVIVAVVAFGGNIFGLSPLDELALATGLVAAAVIL